jgi:hypothetical protein
MDSKHGKATKQTVRAYLSDRVYKPEPVPTMEEIRREIGWCLIQAEREESQYRPDRND